MSCLVSGCTSNKVRSSLSFFTFPKDKDRHELWCSRMGLTPTMVRKSSTICENHFKADQFKSIQKVQLKKNAVPTIISCKNLTLGKNETSFFNRMIQRRSMVHDIGKSTQAVRSPLEPISQNQFQCNITDNSSTQSSTTSKSTWNILGNSSQYRKLPLLLPRIVNDSNKENYGPTASSLVNNKACHVYKKGYCHVLTTASENVFKHIVKRLD